jgi:hydrogenase-4 component F
MLIFLIILIPIITAIISIFVKKSVRFLESLVALASTAELALGITIASMVAGKEAYSPNDYFSVDAFGAILILIISIVGFVTSWYSIGYLREEVRKEIIGFRRVRQYFVLFSFFLAAMFSAVVTTSPVIMWISVEATTLSTALLISFYNKPSAMEAAWKYLIVNSIGLLLGFFGTLLFLSSVSDFSVLVDWNTILASSSSLNPFVAKAAFIFILIGYGTKMGIVPMHTWLPDAHSKAPVPISALLSGVLLNVAFFAILRFKMVADSVLGIGFTQTLLIFFGTISIMLPAFIIFIQKNYKRLLAYSSIEHMGIMALGFGFGGVGVLAALVHMIYHSLAKSILFLASGNVFVRYSSTKILNIKGVSSVLPITGILFLVGLLTLTGIPPFGMFFTEFYILSAGIVQYPVIVAIVLFSLAVVFIGFLKNINAMLYGDPLESLPKGENNLFLLVPPIILVVLLAAFSIFMPLPIFSLINSAASIYH